MRCLVFAYSEIGVEGIQTLVDLGEDVVGVVTHVDHPSEVRWFRSVQELAESRGIPTISPEDPNVPDVLAWAKDRRPDIVFSFYYRNLLKRPLLKLGRLGAFNLHGSLLPKFRGRAPINWAIIEGALETGLTLHEMLEKPDAGAIVAQQAVPIGDNENAREVFDKVVPAVRPLLAGVLPLLREGSAPRRAQDPAEATYFGARKPEDGLIDWYSSARRIHNMVRALTEPYPGAFTFFEGKKLFIWKGTDRAAAVVEGSPGTIFPASPLGVPVATGSGTYTIHEVGFDAASRERAADVLKPGIQFGRKTIEPVGERT